MSTKKLQVVDPSAPATGTSVSVGKIPALPRSGLFVLGDAKELDARWSPHGGGGWYVDIQGPNAARLAGREGAHKREQLVDGTWRIRVPDEPTAGAIRQSVQSLCGAQGWTDSVEIRSAGAAATRVRDAAREHGAGIFGHLAGLNITAAQLEVIVDRDANGDLICVRLVPSH